MKVGLLTFHEYNNYGAVLQTYASLQILKSIGAEGEVINLRRRPRNGLVSQVYNQVFNRNFQKFRNIFLTPCTKRYYENDDLRQLNSCYEAFIVGSDQVWRPQLTQGLVLNYFLDFVDEEKLKIAYAASFGISSWNQSEDLTSEIKNLLQSFNSISVREDSGVDICRRVFGVDAHLVLDPTLLLSSYDYTNMLGNMNLNLPKSYAVTFFLDADSNKYEQNLRSKLLGFKNPKTISLSIPNFRFLSSSYNYNPKSVLKWIYTLKFADFIITDSFHCVVFAIIFQKNFICVVNSRRGVTRLQSFLGMLGLKEHLVEKDQLNKEKILAIYENPIDYNKIYLILDQKKKISLKYLKEALKVL